MITRAIAQYLGDWTRSDNRGCDPFSVGLARPVRRINTERIERSSGIFVICSRGTKPKRRERATHALGRFCGSDQVAVRPSFGAFLGLEVQVTTMASTRDAIEPYRGRHSSERPTAKNRVCGRSGNCGFVACRSIPTPSFGHHRWRAIMEDTSVSVMTIAMAGPGRHRR